MKLFLQIKRISRNFCVVFDSFVFVRKLKKLFQFHTVIQNPILPLKKMSFLLFMFYKFNSKLLQVLYSFDFFAQNTRKVSLIN